MEKKIENMRDAELQRLLDQAELKIRDLTPSEEINEPTEDKLITTPVEPLNSQLDEVVKCRSKIEEELRKRKTRSE